ncbi:mechanosensitive ion channel family protein [Salisaeta longa]|uniref:mechanosensitive ion channel family protein n=1 Tax=Salisaeta longa TaxID=503170 RepID=UPI00040424BA|nr:mechanosensitive ion channel domain-containing protein [Salisaeta longa]
MESIPFVTPENVDLFVQYTLNIVAFIAILIAARIIAGWVRKLIRRALERPEFDKTLSKFLGTFSYYAVFLLGIVVALNTVGVAAASLAAALAAAGFAVGLALQGSLSNFAAGIMLLIFRPFSVGDYVTVGGETGFVRELQLFYTKIDTRANELVIIPNSAVFGSVIRNEFAYDIRWAECAVGTDYPADLDETRAVLTRAAESVDGRVEDKNVSVALTELGGSSINWKVRIWVRSEDYFQKKQALTRAVKYALDDAGIGIPYPQMDVHLDKLDG